MRLDPREAARLRGLLRQATDPREKARLRGFLKYATPEARIAHGELTRQKMTAPGVRERIRGGMERDNVRKLAALREAWRRAQWCVREQFLAEVARVVPVVPPIGGTSEPAQPSPIDEPSHATTP